MKIQFKKLGKKTMAVAMAAVMTLTGTTIAPDNTKTAKAATNELAGLSDFSMGDVVVTDAYYDNALQKEIAYLKKLDADKFLAGFRETAGYAAGMNQSERTEYMNGATRYTGYDNWENSLIAGHTVGHYLSALAQAVANPGTSDADREILATKLENMIDALKDCQDKTVGSTKCEEGYLFAAKIIDTTNLEKQFDNVEINATNIGTQAWVPWYTMHKILAGLVDTYKLTGNETALEVAEGLGEWTYNRANAWSAGRQTVVLNIEYGGMNDVLYELAKCTKDAALQEKILVAAHKFDEVTMFEAVYKETPNYLNDKHANTTVPKFIGALNRYRTLKELDKLNGAEDEKYLAYAEKFWDTVVNKHSYITGGNSEWEHFGKDHVLNAERTNCNNETCNTYNMLKLSRELFKITGEKKYSDYYERVLINAIVASQNPETGMNMYFQPMATGYFKVYSTETQDFWCCTGSGMENFTKLNDSIYYYKGNSVVINQYRSSVLTWEEQNLKLIQEADLLTKTTQTFTVNAADGSESAVDVDLLFRIPDYATKGNITIKVNGEAYTFTKVNGYAKVEGTFADGDVITVDIPMGVTAENLADSENTYGFMYGPFVLCAQLGTESMEISTTGVTVNIPTTKIVSSENILMDYTYDSVDKYIEDLNNAFVKTVKDGSVSFKMTGTNQELTFVPYYSEHKQRYGIYWNLLSDEAGIENAKVLEEKTAAKESKELDVVQPGYGQNEVTLKQENSESQTATGNSRWANEGGYFSYDLKVDAAADTTLIAQFAKEDNGKTIKITVGGEVVATETLNYTGDEDKYSKLYTISKDLISRFGVASGNDTLLTVKFESAKAEEASAALWNELYTYKKIGTTAELASVTSTKGKVSVDGTNYKVLAAADATEVDVTLNLKDTNGYVTLNGNAVTDGKTKTIDLGSNRIVEYDVRVYAEDFVTYKEYKLSVVKDYEKDEAVEYFVDCGDYNVTTVSEGDKLGTHNSVTDQVYGKDPVTGYEWGIVDTVSDPLRNGTSEKTEDAAYTDNTWPFEFLATGDGVPKTESNRYTKNQFENGIPERYLDYSFELENGTYDVEIGFANPWNCSNNPNVYLNYGEDDQVVLGTKIAVGSGKVITGSVTVKDGKLTVNARSDANDSTTLAINMTYIKIINPEKLKEQQNAGNNGTTVTPGTSTNTDKKVGATAVSVKSAGYTLKGNKITLAKGKKATLVASVSPAEADQKVTYVSSKTKVATVSAKGVIKAKKPGTAKITVKAANGKVKVITVKVVKKEKMNKKLALKKTKLSLKKGKTVVIGIKSMTAGTTSKLTYKSDKKKIAVVDKFGAITAKKKGKAVITVKCGKATKKIKVTVK